MSFTSYFLIRYFRYFLAINLSLTFIFTFIEFFEKMMRVSHTTIAAIVYFLSINFLPTFFDYFPVSTWLAAFLVLREMHTHNEWDTLAMLGIKKGVIERFFVLSGLLLMSISFAGKELFTYRMARQAATFKREEFKQSSPFKIYDKWFILNDGSMCHLGFVDLSTGHGQDFLVINHAPDLTVKKILSCDEVSLDPVRHEVVMKNVQMFNQTETIAHPSSYAKATEDKEPVEGYERLHVPALFTQLNLAAHPPSIGELSRHLFLSKTYMARSVRKPLLAEWLSRMLWHLQMVALPWLTFLLFCLGGIPPQKRWFLMLLPYPLYTLVANASLYLGTQNTSLAPLFLAPACIFILIFALKSRVFQHTQG